MPNLAPWRISGAKGKPVIPLSKNPMIWIDISLFVIHPDANPST
jgi:hypothetical protein